MKLIASFAVAFISLASFANAATTITASNFTFAGGLDGVVLTNADGTRLGNFSLSVGVYSGETFTINGTSSLVNFNAATTNTWNTSVSSAVVTAGDAFLGNNIFIAIGNGATLASSTQVIYFDTGVAWAAEDPVLGGSASVNLSAATPVPGTFVETTADVSGVAAPFNTLTSGITFVPEPSAALLGLLGAVGLIRRRR